jgi:hypothetical protein
MNFHLKTLCLLFLLLIPVAPASATSIVCIRTADAIAIAADSELAVKGGDNPGKPCRERKIIQERGVFFSMTGFVKDPARPYDAVRIVSEALKRDEDFAGSASSVAEAVKEGLRDEVAKLRAEAPGLYEKFISAERGTLVEILLACFEEGTPKMALLGFKQVSSPSGELAITVERVACPGNCNPQGVNAFFLGDRRPIDAFLKSGKADWRSPEKAAKTLVDAVIDARTPNVGPPVDVLRIDKEGARWIERKTECPDITEQKTLSHTDLTD